MMDRREERSVAPVPAAFPPLVGKAVAGWVRICPGQTKALAQRSLVSPGSVAFPFEGAYSVRLFSLRAPVGLCALILKGNHSSIGRNVHGSYHLTASRPAPRSARNGGLGCDDMRPASEDTYAQSSS